MTDNKLLQQALEALESCCEGDYSTGHVVHPSYDKKAVDAAIEAIRSEIAKPKPEPVAWVDPERLETLRHDSAIPATLSGARTNRFTAALFIHQ